MMIHWTRKLDTSACRFRGPMWRVTAEKTKLPRQKEEIETRDFNQPNEEGRVGVGSAAPRPRNTVFPVPVLVWCR